MDTPPIFLNTTFVYISVNISQLLEHAGLSPYELEDRGKWLTQSQVNRFYEYILINTDNAKIAQEAGRFAAESNSSTLLRQYAVGFLTPSVAYWMLEKLRSTLSKHIKFKVTNLTPNKSTIIATLEDGVKEEIFQCENRIGLFEGLAKIFTGNYANVEHPDCFHKGNKYCKYIVTWKITPSLISKLVSRYFSAFGLFSSLAFIFILPLNIWLYYFLTILLLSISSFLISEHLSKLDLEKSAASQQNVAEQLINQFNVRYNELSLIKELGEASANIFDPQELLNFTSSALQNRLNFKRGMLMLPDPEKTKLLYMAGYGYTSQEESIIKNTNFSLTKHDSRGIFHLAFHQQKPFIVDDIDNIKDDISERTMNYIKSLRVKSFICVPIIYEGKSEGILAFDNSGSENPATQSDLSLLIGVAQQLGISLNNARAHKKLKESEERFRSLSNNAPDIIYRTNISGYITYINRSWEELLGHKISDIQDNPLFGFVRFEEQQNFKKVLSDIINKQITIRDQNFIFLNHKGLPRYMTFTGTPDLDAEGNVIGVVGTLKDITKLRSMEAQLLQASKLEAIGTLTGGVAHDFNNIIQAIMGYNQIMMTGRKDSETQKKYLENVKELILRSRELVQQLLLYGRKSDSELKPVNINEEIDNMNKLLSKSIPKMIKIKTSLANNLLPVMSDPNQIGQILMNLVINARDALGDSGTITICTKNVDLTKTDSYSDRTIVPGYYVSFSVSDTGCGMDKDVFQHIFEPFFTTKEVGKGTGLGLSVVQGIVDNLKGYIFCNSVPDKGTTFEILLPSTEEYAFKAAGQERPQIIKRGKERLLIVDDESYVLESVKESLSSYGYKVMTADSTDQALSLYSENKEKINLILLDLNMPGHGGKKCLTDLLSISKSAKILMTSGYSTAQQIDDLLRAGASGFIVKPYRTEELISSIRNILDHQAN